MKRSRFTEERIIAILPEQEAGVSGRAVPNHGLSSGTFYKWKAKYGDLHRSRGGRKRAIGTRRPMETPLMANQRWSLDFVSDHMTDGRSPLAAHFSMHEDPMYDQLYLWEPGDP